MEKVFDVAVDKHLIRTNPSSNAMGDCKKAHGYERPKRHSLTIPQQEAFIKLFLSEKSFENDEHIKAWLLRVTTNLCKNKLKSAWYKLSLPLEAAVDIKTENEPEDDFLSYLFSLKPKYRITLYMYYYEGYSIKEISEITSEKENTIISRLSRGRSKLKEILIKENYNEIR